MYTAYLLTYTVSELVGFNDPTAKVIRESGCAQEINQLKNGTHKKTTQSLT
jgi:hypothetical protein